MFLIIGSILLAGLLIFVLEIYVFKKIPIWLSKVIVIVVSVSLILTATVHGIWLGISFLTIGLIYIKINQLYGVTKWSKIFIFFLIHS